MSDLAWAKAAQDRFYAAAWGWLHTPVLYRGEHVERRAIAGYSQKYLDAAQDMASLSLLLSGITRATDPEAVAKRYITVACGELGIAADEVLAGPDPAETHTGRDCYACIVAMPNPRWVEDPADE